MFSFGGKVHCRKIFNGENFPNYGISSFLDSLMMVNSVTCQTAASTNLYTPLQCQFGQKYFHDFWSKLYYLKIVGVNREKKALMDAVSVVHMGQYIFDYGTPRDVL